MAIATEPTKWIRPLGESADVNAIADEYKGENSISFKELFPPITQLPLSAGGVCPDRKDTNALYKLLGDYIWYAQHGGIPTYSEDFDYHVGAFVEYEGKTYICTVANGAGTVVKVPTDTSAWSQIMSLADVGNQFVSLSDSQTVAGVKTFSSVTKSATPSASASGTEVVTAAWARARLAKLLPAGTIVPFAGANIPSGFLLCNGSAVSRTLYADLFSAIGTVWGTGDGSTTFNLPDARDRFLEGAGSNSLGAYLEAGLPNITGDVGVIQNGLFTLVSGAFTGNARTRDYSANFDDTTSNWKYHSATLKASSSNSVYSKSSTVQPKAINTNYLIKY